MDCFIRNLNIIICCIFFYYKLSNNKISKIYLPRLFICIIVLAYFSSFINRINTGIVFLLLFVLIKSILIICAKDSISEYFTYVMAFSFSYITLFIAAAISCIILIPLPFEIANEYTQLLCFAFSLVGMRIPFLFKRTQKGIVFLKHKINNFQIVCISIIIILLASIMNDNIYDYWKLIFCSIIICFSILLFLYWRTSITRHYLERLSLRNIDSLNAELVEKTNYIKELEEDKARIEKLNHKNYKLVPAMEGAVMHYLDGVKSFMESNADNPAFAELAASNETDMTEFIDEGNRLLGELNKMLAEWEDIVHNDDIDGKKDLPVCGVTRVDYILSYMYERSLKENFVLKVDVDSELTGLTEKIITDEDLGTLIADLIENAIIATRYNNGKDILVRLGMMKKEYTIEVYDSGIPFDKEVLAKYGYEQITTHADDSGSGIGMMQTYEILSKCGASLFIDEFAEGEGMYTKRISVVFNKKHQYVLYTKRSDEEVAYLKKRSDLMIVRK